MGDRLQPGYVHDESAEHKDWLIVGRRNGRERTQIAGFIDVKNLHLWTPKTTMAARGRP